jgi:hypothetical protein
MRLSEFWTLMDEEFGASYARLLARTHVLGSLGGLTAQQALEAGERPRTVWVAMCQDMDVPVERRLGRDHPSGRR